MTSTKHPEKRIALYARVSTSKCEKCGKRQSVHEALDHEYKGRCEFPQVGGRITSKQSAEPRR
jgi:translation initiation factor 2 beta subunit (eIF-2beta)/eIF-5